MLDGIELTASPGMRIGLVGQNGCGKSTLLRVAAEIEAPTRGTVRAPGDIGFLAQDTGLRADATIAQVLAAALAPLHDAVRDLESLAADLTSAGAAAAYDEKLAWVTRHDAWSADARAAAAGSSLGLAHIDPAQPVGSLSGGQQTRLALAALLARRPDCLLLDEPTNHLDDAALEFLQQQLLDSAGILVAASHDRVFLDAVCTTIVDLDRTHFGVDGRGGRTYTGNYSDFREQQRKARVRWQEDFEAQQEELSRLRLAAKTTNLDVAHNRPPRDGDKFIHAFKGSRVQQTVSRRRRNAEQRIAEVERSLIAKPPKPLRFAGAFTADYAGSLAVRNARTAGRFAVERLDIAAGEHVLLTGANGSGKSSLLAAIAGELVVAEGSVDVSSRRIGFLRQEIRFSASERTPIQAYGDDPARPSLDELGLLPPRDARRPIRELSLGQQQRLALALLIADLPDLVLLDEPTNHLSLRLVEELEAALLEAAPTVIVASHDRWLRGRWQGTTHHLQPPVG
ncbi:ATP-binding cassette domain-containing protein [Calidifontibacter terrae]